MHSSFLWVLNKDIFIIIIIIIIIIINVLFDTFIWHKFNTKTNSTARANEEFLNKN